jgi:hypothetical protein
VARRCGRPHEDRGRRVAQGLDQGDRPRARSPSARRAGRGDRGRALRGRSGARGGPPGRRLAPHAREREGAARGREAPDPRGRRVRGHGRRARCHRLVARGAREIREAAGAHPRAHPARRGARGLPWHHGRERAQAGRPAGRERPRRGGDAQDHRRQGRQNPRQPRGPRHARLAARRRARRCATSSPTSRDSRRDPAPRWSDAARRTGARSTALVHGAGVLADKLHGDRRRTRSSTTCLDTKIDGPARAPGGHRRPTRCG